MNTVFARLEGHLQSWGSSGRFVIRDTNPEPTKSGVVGLVCACLGIRREDAEKHLPRLNSLQMGVRIDRPGVRTDDYHTVGGRTGSLTAEKKIKVSLDGEIETSQTIRFYLADASFLVALQGDGAVVAEVAAALQSPKFPPFLGRRACVPSVPVYAGTGDFGDLKTALSSIPWRPRTTERPPDNLRCVVEVRDGVRPGRAVVNDVLEGMIAHRHSPRLVEEVCIPCVPGDRIYPVFVPPVAPKVKNKDYWDTIRAERITHDHGLCVTCQLPAEQVHHVTYERGGHEEIGDLRSVCCLCHDAMTAIEYQLDMDRLRIDPADPKWKKVILANRDKHMKKVTA